METGPKGLMEMEYIIYIMFHEQKTEHIQC